MKKHENIQMEVDVLGALGCMNNADLKKKISRSHIAYHVHFSTSVSA